MNETKLTIGIPVFNGAKHIRQSLDSILPQLTELNINDVEVLVSDNASTDGTKEIVSSYIEKYPLLILYYRNPENVGYDNNVDLVVSRAKGEYVWLLGCGEIVKPFALPLVLSLLKENTYDSVVINFDIYSEKKEKNDTDNNFGISRDVVFTDRNEFIVALGGAALAVSSNIVLRSSWLQEMEKPLLVKGWCHIERILWMIMSSRYQRSLYISRPCFTLYREIDGWWTRSGIYFNIVIYYKIICQLKSMGMNFGAYYTFLNRFYPMAFVEAIRETKKINIEFDRIMIMESIKVLKSKISFWLLFLPVLILPNSVFKYDVTGILLHKFGKFVLKTRKYLLFIWLPLLYKVNKYK